jgi:uncharacterized heparinase superfamily protein
MYHAIVLDDVLDLINLMGMAPECVSASLTARLRQTAGRMLRWLRVMTHPDGEISLFNDAAFGIAPDCAALTDYARRLGVPIDTSALATIEALPDSGYVRLQNARAVVICDVASIGPDYMPGHAHADTLSFELSLGDQRVLVNGGTSTYEAGVERQRQRSTSAHNTVVVDQEDSSEVWGGFRVARRARPFGVLWAGGEDAGRLWLRGSHDGYRRLPGRVTHHRRWLLSAEELLIEDRLDGGFNSASAMLHLHPAIEAPAGGPADAGVALRMDDRRIAEVAFQPPTAVSLEPTTWHPEFGRSVESILLRANLGGNGLATRVTWR